jgi:hypothetical protein
MPATRPGAALQSPHPHPQCACIRGSVSAIFLKIKKIEKIKNDLSLFLATTGKLSGVAGEKGVCGRIRQHTSAYGSIRQLQARCPELRGEKGLSGRIRQHTAAYGSIRQHTSTTGKVSRVAGGEGSQWPHTAAYVSIRQLQARCLAAPLLRQNLHWCTSKASKLRNPWPRRRRVHN